jgi:hypothetical protein
MSFSGGAWDIVSGGVGTVPIATGQWYFIELTFDALQGKYYVYVNGALDQTITSTARPCAGAALTFGGNWNGSAPISTSMSGYIDECELVPYCDHPAGTAYAVPTAARTVNPAGALTCWFDIPNMVMREVTGPSTAAGTNPVFTTRTRLFAGEAITGLTTVSSVTSYAYAGRYDSGRFPVSASTPVSKSHNLGVEPLIAQAYVATSQSAPLIPAYYLYSGNYYGGTLNQITRLTAAFYPGSAVATPDSAGGLAGAAYTQAKMFLSRGW